MDGTEDDSRYPTNPYGVNHHGGYQSHRRLQVRNSLHSQPVANEYVEDNDDDDGDEVEEDEDQLVEEDYDDVDQSNSAHLSQKNVVPDNDDEGDEDRDEDENAGNNDDDDDNNNDEDYDAKPKVYSIKDEDDLWHPKKRKLKSLISAYEFAPRVPAPSAAAPSVPKPPSGGRKSLTDWTEPETFVLLDAWGDKFLHNGRKSLRSEEWQEVAEKVSEVSKIQRTDAQCRNRLDTLKKKYKKEKTKSEKMSSKWVYFHRMDKLMSSPPQEVGLSCGVDSGEYVFMNPRVYLNRANGLDEMRDSPENSESTGEEVSDGLKLKKRRSARDGNKAYSFRLLANSIHKFSEIFEKIENNKRQQMVELEKMRMEIYRDLETQKRQILERVQSEISRLHQRDDEENDD